MQPLEQEFDRGGDDRGLLGASVTSNARADPPRQQAGHLAHPGDVLARRRPVAGLDR